MDFDYIFWIYDISEITKRQCYGRVEYLKSFVKYLEDKILEEKVLEKRYMSKEDFDKMLTMRQEEFREFISK